MIKIFLERIDRWFERMEQRRKHEYLEQARNLVELEYRMRSLERNGYPRVG
jgi:hypothetical protein